MARSSGAGTILLRNFALGASTPWNRIRWRRWEIYDLATDPSEIRNLGYENCKRTPEQEAEFARLQTELAAVEQDRLQPFAG